MPLRCHPELVSGSDDYTIKKIDNKREITIYEIKSTNKKDIKANFEKYFFGLSTAELLVAQNLREYFKFIFVNTNTKETMELTLKQVFEKQKVFTQFEIFNFSKSENATLC